MKGYLSQKGLSYEEKNVAEDQEALRELTEELGYMSTPVTLIEGQAVVGFDARKLDSLLGS